MNAQRRKAIEAESKSLVALLTPEVLAAVALVSGLASKLEDANSAIETLRDEEQESYDNMPESLQQGERGDLATSAIEALEEAVSQISDLKDEIETISETVEGISDKISEIESYLDTAAQ